MELFKFAWASRQVLLCCASLFASEHFCGKALSSGWHALTTSPLFVVTVLLALLLAANAQSVKAASRTRAFKNACLPADEVSLRGLRLRMFARSCESDRKGSSPVARDAGRRWTPCPGGGRSRSCVNRI